MIKQLREQPLLLNTQLCLEVAAIIAPTSFLSITRLNVLYD